VAFLAVFDGGTGPSSVDAVASGSRTLQSVDHFVVADLDELATVAMCPVVSAASVI
jgi:hypothetical protein